MHPKGPRNPRRVRLEKETGADNPELAVKFRDEMRAILECMGEDAPSQDSSVVPLIRGDRRFFIVGGAMLTWDAATQTAWKIHEANGSERFECWRDGRRIGDIHPPREPIWN